MSEYHHEKQKEKNSNSIAAPHFTPEFNSTNNNFPTLNVTFNYSRGDFSNRGKPRGRCGHSM